MCSEAFRIWRVSTSATIFDGRICNFWLTLQVGRIEILRTVREEVEEGHEDDGVDPSEPVKLETVPEGREEGFVTTARLSTSLCFGLGSQENL